MDDTVTLFLSGDVMLGRGVDQILPHPGDPVLHERVVRDARDYVTLAERVNGPIPRPVDVTWPWGEALAVLDAAAPDVRILNLETTVTTADGFADGKAVHYRMHPANLPGLLAVRPDACVLANNHVLDFGVPGLLDTLDTLTDAGIATVGAGRDEAAARAPVTIPLAGGSRVLLWAWGTADSGIPAGWAAAGGRPGVAHLDGPSDAAAQAVLAGVQRHRRRGDIVVVSIHWGPNWNDRVHRREVRFAHALVDGGVDVVHGHSSHHPRPAEVHRGRLVLYGCGDLIDDYEGIGGHDAFRPDLRLLHLVTLSRDDGELRELRMVPMQARRLRLERAAPADVDWLRGLLDRLGPWVANPVRREPDGTLLIRPA